MSQLELPDKPVLNSEFARRGRPDVVMIDAFPVRDGELLKLSFESKESPWRQGVWLKAAGEGGQLVVNTLKLVSFDLWQDTAPNEVLIECHSRKGLIHLYNIWEKEGRRSSQSWSSGMLVDEHAEGRRYRCNDIGFDTDFISLVFRLERLHPAQ
jgi:hypothetical protein